MPNKQAIAAYSHAQKGENQKKFVMQKAFEGKHKDKHWNGRLKNQPQSEPQASKPEVEKKDASPKVAPDNKKAVVFEGK